MYSGLTLTKFSGRVLGAHQKIDRVARRHLTRLLPESATFPKSKQILHFEGRNGPDAIKRKSPSKDEPWHLYSPFDNEDSQLIELIRDHYNRLVKELKAGNQERIAFEAAWLAHALVDGLTPAHHYPYEEKLAELRGEGLETRTSIKKKWIIPGETLTDRVKNNWKMWGAKGLITTHGLFEMGVATIIAPLNFSDARPSAADIRLMQKIGPIEWFKRTAREIAALDMYGTFYQKGWTSKLAYQVRHDLGPPLVKTVCLTWHAALVESGKIK